MNDLKKFGLGCCLVFFGGPVLLLICGILFGAASTIYDKAAAQINTEKRAAEQRRLEEEQRRLEEDRRCREEAARKAAEEARQKREERLRAFTVREAPLLLKTYQDLQGAVVEQNKRIADLAKTLREFGKDPKQDADYRRICSMRDEMVAAVGSMHGKMEDAYIAYCKFQATPSRKDYDELRKKMLEDGIREAESAARRFDQMRSEK